MTAQVFVNGNYVTLLGTPEELMAFIKALPSTVTITGSTPLRPEWVPPPVEYKPQNPIPPDWQELIRKRPAYPHDPYDPTIIID